MVFAYPLAYLDGLELLDRFWRTFCSITQYTSVSLARDTVTKPNERNSPYMAWLKTIRNIFFRAQFGSTDYFDRVCVVQYTE